ncbi:hypothetical protein Plhal304r1_c009g0037511 [Plasmopara halstedii]
MESVHPQRVTFHQNDNFAIRSYDFDSEWFIQNDVCVKGIWFQGMDQHSSSPK